jgi:hypothetical protein
MDADVFRAAMRAKHPNGEVEFERRRYGRTTYTWAYVWFDGERHSCGEPWPSVMPKKAELAVEVAAILAKLSPSSITSLTQ